jgi:hypothetical protein
MKRTTSLLACGLFACSLIVANLAASWLISAEPATKGKAPTPEAKDRARKQVRMLDDVYKTAVVLITDKYVNDKDDFPAGSAAIALFSEIGKKGWHTVRLLDVSGEPYDSKNVAADDFEKKGVGQLKNGKDYFEEFVEKDGKPYLRAMTAVPVVMQKCVMCHPNYANAKKGAAVGAISYTMPVE